MKKLSVPFIGFLQAFGLTAYCGLIGLVVSNGNTWFGPLGTPFGPVLVLSLLVVSVLICALIAGGYPFLVFWNKKNTKEALTLVAYTAGWLLVFVLIYMFLLSFF